MKNYLLSALLLLCAISMNAQDDMNTTQNYNEFKLNGLYLVAGAFDITYERTLNEESGFGITLFVPFDDDIKDDVNYYISPYYRMYFGKKHAAGFFVEGFGMLNSVNDEELYLSQPGGDLVVDEDNVTDFALGIGVGGKWVTNRGFIGEIGFGFGRNLFNSNRTNNDFVGKVNISIGYRF